MVYTLLCFGAPGIASADPFSNGGALFTTEPEFLPVEEAFRFESFVEGGSRVLNWQITNGYYLYKNRIQVNAGGETLSLQLPEGKHKQDEYFGDVEVYYGQLTFDVAELGPLEVIYQGCADAGLCYPPEKLHVKSAK